MSDETGRSVSEFWRSWFETGDYPGAKRERKIFGLIPKSPRCKLCHAPFEGIGAPVARAFFGKRRSSMNPRFCTTCEETIRRLESGAEVAMSILFADVRGSTALSERMNPTEFSKLINRFYTEATRVIVEADGLVDKLAGDSVAAFFGAGLSGPAYVNKTIDVARQLLRVTGHADAAGPWIPVGIGVHAGVAYFGSMGMAGGLTDITAVGEEVNTAARLAAEALTGEIVVSESALERAGVDASALQQRRLTLKGISQPVAVRVMRLS